MKATFFAFVVCFLVYANSSILEDLRNPLFKHEEACLKESGFKGTLKSMKLEGIEKEGKCFISCLFLQEGIMKKDGTFDAGSLTETLKVFPANVTEVLLKVFKDCAKDSKENQKDICETAYAFNICEQQALLAALKP